MTAESYRSDGSLDFSRLMADGRSAYQRGDHKRAHDLWRQAALIDPYNEQVWLALLDVMDTPEDRQVCLQNILAINPMNVQARRTLRADEAAAVREAKQTEKREQQTVARRRQRRMVIRRAIVMGILLGVSGAIFAVLLSILIYAG